ncbi:MAG: hypothetical protein ABIG68_09975, partial [Acidobacteriota bacterium]
RSQLFDADRAGPSTYLSRPDFVSQVEAIHSYYGSLIGRKSGEAFFAKEILEVGDPVGFFRAHAPYRFRY